MESEDSVVTTTSDGEETSEASRDPEEDIEDDDVDVDDDENGEEGEDDDDLEGDFEDDEDDENLTLEEKYEKLQEENEELEETIRSVLKQYNQYKDLIDSDKDKEKARVESLKKELEEEKQRVRQLEEDIRTSSDSMLREKLEETEAKLEETEGRLRAAEQEKAKLRATANANLDAIRQQVQIAESTNISLNDELTEERELHRQTLAQLIALQKESKMPVPQIRDQEIRLRVSFEGSSITSATLIPENDEERAKLKEEKEFFRTKFLGLKQDQVMLKKELDESLQNLKKSVDQSEKVSSELAALKERHAQALKEIEHLKEQSPETSASASPISTPKPAGDRLSCRLPQSQSMMTVEDQSSRFNDAYIEALRMYETYFLAGSEMELPLSQETKRRMFRFTRDQDVRPNLFADAKKELISYMNTNFFEEWKKEQEGENIYASFDDVFAEAGESAAEKKESVTKFFEKKEKPQFMAFLKDTTAFALQKFSRSSSLTDIGSLSRDGDKDDKKHHKKKKHSHKSTKAKTPDADEPQKLSKEKKSDSSYRKSCPPGVIDGVAPPLPPLPSGPVVVQQQQSQQQQVPSTAAARRLSSPGVDDLQGIFIKSETQSKEKTQHEPEPEQPQKLTRPQVISRTMTTPAGNLSALLSGGVGSSANMASPRTQQAASQLMGRKTIRKTNRFNRITVDGAAGESGIPSLYGGPVSPEQLTPRTVKSMMAELQSQASSAAPVPHVALDGIELPASPVSPAAPASPVAPVVPKVTVPATSPNSNSMRHMRQPSMGSTGLTRNTTMFVQKLQELVGGSGAHQDVSLLTSGNVRAITAVDGNVWVAHNNPAPDGQKVAPSIAVYDRDTLVQKPEVMLPTLTVNNMVYAGKHVWVANSSPDLICINPSDSMFQHVLKGHTGSITDLANMGKYMWTIGADQKIGVWDVSTMKLRKMAKGSVMNCIICVGGFAWIGTVRGIQRYSIETLKLAKEPQGFGESEQYKKMAVSKMLLVNNYVWAVHHDENMISVWEAETKMFITSFPAHDVVSMLHVGSLVWMTSHDHIIRCYDITTFSKVGELTGMHQDWVTCMFAARHKDGLRVWTGSADATIVLWDACVRPHDFVLESSRPGNCEVCKRTLKSLGGKILRCRNCNNFCIHLKCQDLLPCGCTCSALDTGIEHSIAASASKL